MYIFSPIFRALFNCKKYLLIKWFIKVKIIKTVMTENFWRVLRLWRHWSLKCWAILVEDDEASLNNVKTRSSSSTWSAGWLKQATRHQSESPRTPSLPPWPGKTCLSKSWHSECDEAEENISGSFSLELRPPCTGYTAWRMKMFVF